MKKKAKKRVWRVGSMYAQVGHVSKAGIVYRYPNEQEWYAFSTNTHGKDCLRASGLCDNMESAKRTCERMDELVQKEARNA
jgi:hypothetical protein